MNNPKVSIIVPVYNCKKYINTCINSLINQEYSNYEIIIVDDGSNDGTEKLIDNFKDITMVKIIREKNKGSSAARKKGLMHISDDSKYFCFCDVDDYFGSTFLKDMVNVSEKYDSDITQCNYYKFIGNFKYNDYIPECLVKENIYNNKQIMNYLYKSYFGISNFPGYLHTKLYKRKFASMIIDFSILVNFMADDLSINIRLLPYCQKIATTPKKLYYYRAGGGTSKFMESFMDDYFSYHRLQLELIHDMHLSSEFLYYSQIEIINVFHNWLLMILDFKKANYSQLSKEINKWLSKKEIIDAVYNERICEEWDNSFYLYLKNEDYHNIYRLLKKEVKRMKLKRYIKYMLIKLFDIIRRKQ